MSVVRCGIESGFVAETSALSLLVILTIISENLHPKLEWRNEIPLVTPILNSWPSFCLNFRNTSINLLAVSNIFSIFTSEINSTIGFCTAPRGFSELMQNVFEAIKLHILLSLPSHQLSYHC